MSELDGAVPDPAGTDTDAVFGPPVEATSVAAFVGALRSLKRWSGHTYRELQRRAEAAGDVLPHSTVAAALGRNTLPRAEVVGPFVRACGGDRATVEGWLRVHRRIAADAERAGTDVAAGISDEVDPGVTGSADDTEEGAPDRTGNGTTTPPLQSPAAPETATATVRSGEQRVGLHRRESPDRGPLPDGPRWLPPALRRTGRSTRVLAGVLVVGLVTIAVVLGTTRSTPDDQAGAGTGSDEQTTVESVTLDELATSPAPAPESPVATPSSGQAAPTGGETDAGDPGTEGGSDAGQQPEGRPGLSNPAVLTPYTGPATIDSGTHVITDRKFTGRLTVRGGEVTIRNSSFDFVDFYHLIVEGGKVTVEHSAFDGMNSNTTDMAVMGANLVIRHSTFRRFTNAVRLLGNSRVEFNVIDQPNTVATGASTNGIDVWQGSNMTIRHNVIDIAGGVGSSGCVSVNTDLTGIDNVTIESNDFTGGTYSLQLRAKNGQPLTNVRVRDNRWHTPFAYGTHDVDPVSAVAEWAGNTLNGNPLRLR